MREIKFRGKRTDTGEWIYGSLLTPVGICDTYEISDCNTIDGSRYEIDKNTIGQYTGLKDKNGKEVYEGDIIKAYDGRIQGKVIFDVRGLHFGIRISDTENYTFSQNFLTSNNIEVIGNIYENSELIEEE